MSNEKSLSEKPLSVGIAGLGRSGWSIHCKLLEQLPEKYRVAAVFDNLLDRREEARGRFDCRTYEAYDALIRDADTELVVVALPTHLHAPLSIAALKAGKSVVCEKPMALSRREALSMVKAAKRSVGVLSVFQNRRYDPDFQKLQSVIASGKLGRIVQIRIADHGFGRRWDWQTLKSYGGGSLNNNGSHRIDQALVLMDHPKPEVFCILDRTLTLGDADDHVKVVLKAPGKPTMDIEVTSACAMGQDMWLVMGTQGGLSGSNRELRWRYFDPKELPPLELDSRPTPDRSYNRDSLRLYEESWNPEGDTAPGHLQFYTELYDAIRRGKPAPVTPESVLRQIRVLDECRKQALI